MLLQVEAILGEMDSRSARYNELNEKIQDLETYHEGPPSSGEDAAIHQAMKTEQEAVGSLLEQDVARIHGLGAVLKDYPMGLVDFLGEIEGEIVYLCWKRGEERVGHFHPLEGGFSRRRPIPV